MDLIPRRLHRRRRVGRVLRGERLPVRRHPGQQPRPDEPGIAPHGACRQQDLRRRHLHQRRRAEAPRRHARQRHRPGMLLLERGARDRHRRRHGAPRHQQGSVERWQSPYRVRVHGYRRPGRRRQRHRRLRAHRLRGEHQEPGGLPGLHQRAAQLRLGFRRMARRHEPQRQPRRVHGGHRSHGRAGQDRQLRRQPHHRLEPHRGRHRLPLRRADPVHRRQAVPVAARGGHEKADFRQTDLRGRRRQRPPGAAPLPRAGASGRSAQALPRLRDRRQGLPLLADQVLRRHAAARLRPGLKAHHDAGARQQGARQGDRQQRQAAHRVPLPAPRPRSGR